MPERADYLVDQLFMVLPCASIDEITEKLSRRIRERISRGYVGWLLSHLRKNKRQYEWTVPHVKRGLNEDQHNKRFFAVLVKPDGSLDFGPEHLENVNAGMHSTVAHTASSLSNEVSALETVMRYMTSRARREDMQEVIDDMSYAARKCQRLLHKIDRDGTND